MRKIIVTEFITLDGVIEAPGGNETPHPHGGWQFKYSSPETGKYKIDELATVDALLLGKTTYTGFAAFWPTQTDEAFGNPINRMPKYVVSRSLAKADWNNSHILRDVAKDVAELKKSDGGMKKESTGGMAKSGMSKDGMTKDDGMSKGGMSK